MNVHNDNHRHNNNNNNSNNNNNNNNHHHHHTNNNAAASSSLRKASRAHVLAVQDGRHVAALLNALGRKISIKSEMIICSISIINTLVIIHEHTNA